MTGLSQRHGLEVLQERHTVVFGVQDQRGVVVRRGLDVVGNHRQRSKIPEIDVGSTHDDGLLIAHLAAVGSNTCEGREHGFVSRGDRDHRRHLTRVGVDALQNRLQQGFSKRAVRACGQSRGSQARGVSRGCTSATVRNVGVDQATQASRLASGRAVASYSHVVGDQHGFDVALQFRNRLHGNLVLHLAGATGGLRLLVGAGNGGNLVEQLRGVGDANGRRDGRARAVVAFDNGVVLVRGSQAVALPFVQLLGRLEAAASAHHGGFFRADHVDLVLQVFTDADSVVTVKGFCGLSHDVAPFLKEVDEFRSAACLLQAFRC